MRKPFFKAVVAGMASVAMIAGMSACGRSANNADCLSSNKSACRHQLI